MAKTPEWAAAISGIAADDLRTLARRMASSRTLVTVSWALQRTEHGEQPVWMGIALAALLGQIGLPGGGFGHGYGSMADVGAPTVPYPLPVFAQGRNPVRTYIPVAQITDLLCNPGGTLDFDGTHLHAARHPPRVLGRRQPLPPPPGPEPAAPGLRADPTR